jgi:histidine triad (HIT) family protein
MNDLFLKIINGEIPAVKVYEDEYTMAFLDIKPVNPGHTLVIPKEHSKNFLETPDDTIQRLFPVAKKVANAVKKAVDADGINIHINNEPAAGQVVFHTHIHIIPRFEGDGLRLWGGNEYKKGEDEKIGTLIRENLEK